MKTRLTLNKIDKILNDNGYRWDDGYKTIYRFNKEVDSYLFAFKYSSISELRTFIREENLRER